MPAEFEVVRTDPDGTSSIFACAGHVAHTKAVLSREDGDITVRRADPATHGCKGHLENWPAG